MTIDQQQEFFKVFTGRMKEIMLMKGDDYAASTDRLSNFKMAGPIAGVTPEQNCLSLIATKVARLGQLLGPNRDVKNESINDSVLDLANYAVLLAMLINDKPQGISINLDAIPKNMSLEDMNRIIHQQGIIME